jgi:hypothetical protein
LVGLRGVQEGPRSTSVAKGGVNNTDLTIKSGARIDIRPYSPSLRSILSDGVLKFSDDAILVWIKGQWGVFPHDRIEPVCQKRRIASELCRDGGERALLRW